MIFYKYRAPGANALNTNARE